jgi:DNA/RNA endonuclease YhcR with UshA esterase domain
LFWEEDRDGFVAKFRPPELSLQGKVICVTGEIELYKGIPEIELTDPNDLVVR